VFKKLCINGEKHKAVDLAPKFKINMVSEETNIRKSETGRHNSLTSMLFRELKNKEKMTSAARGGKAAQYQQFRIKRSALSLVYTETCIWYFHSCTYYKSKSSRTSSAFKSREF
jgi:translation elongation factor P/translation initiation factor 5A